MTSLRVFVSHATNDAPFANNFSQDLRQLGADVWLDSSHLGAGDFVARINDALQRSDVFVLVLTPSALASQWVQQEMNAAITREKQGILRAIFVVEAQHCPLGAIPPLWTVYNRYDANSDYSAALYGVAEKLGLQVPRAAARANPVSSTPKPPTQEAATPIPPSPTPTPFAYTPAPTPAPPAPISTPSTPAPWSPYPMPISLPHTPVKETPGQPSLDSMSKGKRPAHWWLLAFAALATLLAIVCISGGLGYDIAGVMVVSVITWGQALYLTLRKRAWRWTLAMVVSIVAATWAGIFLISRYNGHGYVDGEVKLFVTLFSAAAFILPLRIGYKGLGKSSRAEASPPPYATAAPSAPASPPLPTATSAPAATPLPAAAPAPSWRRPAHRWIFWPGLVATAEAAILFSFLYVRQTQGENNPPFTNGFQLAVIAPGVVATLVVWLSALLLTLSANAWKWATAVAIPIVFTIFVLLAVNHNVKASLTAISLALIVSYLLPLRIGLVGLGPKREK